MKALSVHAGFFACILVLLSPAISRGDTSGQPDANLTALFVTYYTAVEKGQWVEAFQHLHDRLKTATKVENPDALAQSQAKTQKELIEAFRKFDRLDVV